MTTASRTAAAPRIERRLRRQYLHAFVAAAAVGPFLSYVLADVGWSPAQIGYATAVLTASAVVTAPVWGWVDDVSDGAAARMSLVTTAIGCVLVTISVLHLSTVATLAFIAVLGSASGSIEPLLTSRTLRDPRTATRLGTTRSLGSLGWVLGLLLGGLLLTFIDTSPFVFLLAGAAALSAPTSGPAGAVRPHPARTDRPRVRPPMRAVLEVLSLTFPLALCVSALVYFTAGWARDDLGAGPLVAVGPLALSAALELPAFVLVDRFSRALSPGWLCVLAYPPLSVACLVLALAPSRTALFAVQPLVAMTFTMWFVSQSRLVAERVATHQLASGLALVATLGRGVAGPLAGVLGGAVAAAGGYAALFFTMSAMCAIGLLWASFHAWTHAR